jgi:hypothetical protein
MSSVPYYSFTEKNECEYLDIDDTDVTGNCKNVKKWSMMHHFPQVEVCSCLWVLLGSSKIGYKGENVFQ